MPKSKQRPKPVGITLGDPAGVGPELIAWALKVVETDHVKLYGPRSLVENIANGFTNVTPVATCESMVKLGAYSKESGAASMAALVKATDDLARNNIRSLVTGPISKVALTESGLDFPGQTEYVASVCGASSYAMMLAGPRLKVTLATTHVAIKDLASLLTRKMIVNAVKLTGQFIGPGKIAVLGLNPHAGDGGRFGDEESKIIEPAICELKEAGYDVYGPLPADTAFFLAVQGNFDAVVAMYHDQGLGPLKLLHFYDGVNITLGLPRLRVSPDHGPAFNLAGTRKANPESTIAALKMACAT